MTFRECFPPAFKPRSHGRGRMDPHLDLELLQHVLHISTGHCLTEGLLFHVVNLVVELVQLL